MFAQRSRWLWWLGLTAVFVGYFMVWLPGPSAGLQLMGLEMGEWLKFLGVGSRRDWFYVPPISLGLLLAWQTAVWPPNRWQTWAMRGLALLVALVAFPAVEDLLGPVRTEYLLRVALIGVVALVAMIAAWLARGSHQPASRLYWGVAVLVTVIGLVGPVWQLLTIRPFVAEALRQPLGIGVGVWLHSIGHLLVLLVAWQKLVGPSAPLKNEQPDSFQAAR